MLRIFRLAERAIAKLRGGEAPSGLTVREVKNILKKRDPLVLEIGANEGMHTERFVKVFPRATIHCFEPDSRAVERFRRKGFSSNVFLHQIAIAAKDGEIQFYPSNGQPPDLSLESLPGGWDHSGSILPPKHHLELHPWCSFGEPVVIPCLTLDTWATQQGIDHVDFIWADVQGAEAELIRGGEGILRRTRYLYTEYNDRELYEGQVSLSQLLSLLPHFSIVKKFSDDVLLKNDHYE